MTWKNCLGILSLSFTAGCEGVPPAWLVDLYQGDPDRGAIVRCISPPDVKPCKDWKVIDTRDPIFHKYTCMESKKISERQKQIEDACEEWK